LSKGEAVHHLLREEGRGLFVKRGGHSPFVERGGHLPFVEGERGTFVERGGCSPFVEGRRKPFAERGGFTIGRLFIICQQEGTVCQEGRPFAAVC